jgi:hypothetical protein
LDSSLELCFSSFKKDDTKEASELFDEKFGTIGGKFDDNSTEREVATVDCEYNVLKKDFETKRNSCAIHDGCINSLSYENKETGNKVEDRKHADINVGIRCGECSNQRIIGKLQ